MDQASLPSRDPRSRLTGMGTPLAIMVGLLKHAIRQAWLLDGSNRVWHGMPASFCTSCRPKEEHLLETRKTFSSSRLGTKRYTAVASTAHTYILPVCITIFAACAAQTCHSHKQFEHSALPLMRECFWLQDVHKSELLAQLFSDLVLKRRFAYRSFLHLKKLLLG